MLHPFDANRPVRPLAHRVPWVVIRSDRTHPVVMNGSSDPVDFVTVLRSDAGEGPRVELWGQVLPSETIELCLCPPGEDDVVVTLTWFRHWDGLEYVWHFVV